jgi:hypothetical protein
MKNRIIENIKNKMLIKDMYFLCDKNFNYFVYNYNINYCFNKQDRIATHLIVKLNKYLIVKPSKSILYRNIYFICG